MKREIRYYGKVKIAKEEGNFVFTLKTLIDFIKTQKFTELIITKKKPKKKINL